jgi:hypothetical protein
MAADRDMPEATRGPRVGNHLWLWFSPPSPKGGGSLGLDSQTPRKRVATGGAAMISDEGVCGSIRSLRRPTRGGFLPAFPKELRHDRGRIGA